MKQIIRELEPDTKQTSYDALGPEADFRYVIDPANPTQVIDMRHFLVVGPKGEFFGLLVEIAQGPLGDLLWGREGGEIKESYFNAEDFLSNRLGFIWYSRYFWSAPDADLYTSLGRYFQDRGGLKKKRIWRK